MLSRSSLLVLSVILCSCKGSPSPAGPTAPPPTIVVGGVAGDGQTGIAGFPLADSLSVHVTDQAGRPLQGVSVTWEVLSGSGRVSPQSTTTDSNGRAHTQWTVGSGSGQVRATATISASDTVSHTFASTAQERAPVSLRSTLVHLTEGPTDYGLYLRAIGDLKAALILFDFVDSPAAIPPNVLYEHLAPRAMEWYDQTSFGQTRLEITLIDRWFRAPRSVADYQAISWDKHIEEAIQVADPDLDLAGFDTLILVFSANAPVDADTYEPGFGIQTQEGEFRRRISLGIGPGQTYLAIPYAPYVLAHEIGHLLG